MSSATKGRGHSRTLTHRAPSFGSFTRLRQLRGGLLYQRGRAEVSGPPSTQNRASLVIFLHTRRHGLPVTTRSRLCAEKAVFIDGNVLCAGGRDASGESHRQSERGWVVARPPQRDGVRHHPLSLGQSSV